MKQYFDDDAILEDNPKQLVYDLSGETLKFKTNSGLFAKDNIDDFSASLLKNIEVKKYDNILDLGCGYGFIGIALSKLVEYNQVTFIDVTQRACDYTKINCEYNNVTNFLIEKCDGIQNNNKYDLIVLNPPIHAGKEVVYRLYQQAVGSLNKNGSFYIVIHKKHGAKSTIDYLTTIADKVEVITKKKSLYIIKTTCNS